MAKGLQVDASLISIMLIVLISSALIVFSFAREKIESPVVILKNLYPSILYSQASVTTRERMDFSFSLAARRDIETLEIQYVTLVQTLPVFVGGNQTGDTLEEIASGISPIKRMIEATENDLVSNEVLAVEGSIRNLSYSGIFLDFPIIRLFTDTSSSGQVCSSFLVFENGSDILYFKGISDFFLYRLGGYVDVDLPEGDEQKSAISILRIRENDDVTSYSSAIDAPSDWLGMEQTPDFGRVIFEDVVKHDTFSIDFTVEIPRRPPMWSAQVIRVYADGELVDTEVNLVG
jgi:hypothetical protein